jgi:hypothetical protein
MNALKNLLITLPKGLTTVITWKQPLSTMYALMFLQIILLTERLTTPVTENSHSKNKLCGP